MRAITVFALALMAGCGIFAPVEPGVLEQLRNDVARLEAEIVRAEAANESRAKNSSQRLASMVDGLTASVNSLPARVEKRVMEKCVAATESKCDSPTRSVVIIDDKMLLGETEFVWMDPPGFQLDARIDTGADSSSLHAANITEFERDGDDWTRFDVSFNDLSVTIERPVLKYVRVFQQSDKEGTRRPVVEMRVFLGDIQDTYEFTLADRSHLQHAVILGRNFLQDVALVDVSQQFVQPVYNPTR